MLETSTQHHGGRSSLVPLLNCIKDEVPPLIGCMIDVSPSVTFNGKFAVEGKIYEATQLQEYSGHYLQVQIISLYEAKDTAYQFLGFTQWIPSSLVAKVLVEEDNAHQTTPHCHLQLQYVQLVAQHEGGHPMGPLGRNLYHTTANLAQNLSGFPDDESVPEDEQAVSVSWLVLFTRPALQDDQELPTGWMFQPTTPRDDKSVPEGWMCEDMQLATIDETVPDCHCTNLARSIFIIKGMFINKTGNTVIIITTPLLYRNGFSAWPISHNMVDRDLQSHNEWAPVQPNKMHKNEEEHEGIIGSLEGLEVVEAVPTSDDHVQHLEQVNHLCQQDSHESPNLQEGSFKVDQRITVITLSYLPRNKNSTSSQLIQLQAASRGGLGVRHAGQELLHQDHQLQQGAGNGHDEDSDEMSATGKTTIGQSGMRVQHTSLIVVMIAPIQQKTGSPDGIALVHEVDLVETGLQPQTVQDDDRGSLEGVVGPGDQLEDKHMLEKEKNRINQVIVKPCSVPAVALCSRRLSTASSPRSPSPSSALRSTGARAGQGSGLTLPEQEDAVEGQVMLQTKDPHHLASHGELQASQSGLRLEIWHMNSRIGFTMGKMGNEFTAFSFSSLHYVLTTDNKKVLSRTDMVLISHHPENKIGITRAGQAMYGHLHGQPDGPGEGDCAPTNKNYKQQRGELGVLLDGQAHEVQGYHQRALYLEHGHLRLCQGLHWLGISPIQASSSVLLKLNLMHNNHEDGFDCAMLANNNNVLHGHTVSIMFTNTSLVMCIEVKATDEICCFVSATSKSVCSAYTCQSCMHAFSIKDDTTVFT